MDAQVTSMHHPWMASHLASSPFLSKYLWMPELLCHPWTIHGWLATLPSPLCLSIRGCQSYCGVHGPSMDGQSPCPHSLSKYPWMPELLCHPWAICGWPATLPSPLYLSIRGCQSYCAIHGPSMDGAWMTTVTMVSTDTLTDGVRQGVHSWMVHRWSVTVVHPWMVHGWTTVTMASTDTLTDEVSHGWSTDGQ